MHFWYCIHGHQQVYRTRCQKHQGVNHLSICCGVFSVSNLQNLHICSDLQHNNNITHNQSFVSRIRRGPVDSPQKGPVIRECVHVMAPSRATYYRITDRLISEIYQKSKWFGESFLSWQIAKFKNGDTPKGIDYGFPFKRLMAISNKAFSTFVLNIYW